MKRSQQVLSFLIMFEIQFSNWIKMSSQGSSYDDPSHFLMSQKLILNFIHCIYNNALIAFRKIIQNSQTKRIPIAAVASIKIIDPHVDATSENIIISPPYSLKLILSYISSVNPLTYFSPL